jgi:hypothetical protein
VRRKTLYWNGFMLGPIQFYIKLLPFPLQVFQNLRRATSADSSLDTGLVSTAGGKIDAVTPSIPANTSTTPIGVLQFWHTGLIKESYDNFRFINPMKSRGNPTKSPKIHGNRRVSVG